MKPADFRQLLRDAKLSQSSCARLTGYQPRQVTRWLQGTAPIPESVTMLLMFLGFAERIRDQGKPCRKK